MIKGIHHIGVTVQNVDAVMAFYQAAVALPSVTEEFADRGDTTADPIGPPTVRANDLLASHQRVRSALLDGHTTYLELSQFEDPQPEAQPLMPVYGPGITHVCFQSPADAPVFGKFRAQGATMLSRGDTPVKLARPDITYVYLRDLAGNIVEVEQWDEPPKPFPIWIAHVALVSPNIEQLTHFYSTVLLDMDTPPEIRRINGIANLDIVGDQDSIDLYGTWIPAPNILIEIWQYVCPPTPAATVQGALDRPGYTHICFEVDDLEHEIMRLTAHGVPFLSEPFQTKSYEGIFGSDPDGNLFELRQFRSGSNGGG